ncbi:MAG: uracil-DNA glycosylase [Pelosinus sp.]|nr:uracil-DNA glycosylase [Pelosinus sp.]
MLHLQSYWQELLQEEMHKEYFLNLQQFLAEEYQTKNIFPPASDIFNALNFTGYQDVKVVILGQDPYHRLGQAHGLSFSVKPGIPLPASLRNIFKELQDDLSCTLPKHGYLKKWAEQGVLLLNTVLTVEEGKANSHKNRGWEIFTDKIISLLNEKKTPIVFILWGNHAKSKKDLITNPNHHIIASAHPSPLSARHGFFTSKPFSKTNALLLAAKLPPIDWQLDN